MAEVIPFENTKYNANTPETLYPVVVPAAGGPEGHISGQ